MWFGTDNGLARFDGRRIQRISLGNADLDRVLALELDPNGQLWIGTRGGAKVYVADRFETVENTTNVGITTILYTGDAYLGTDTGRVMRVRRNENGTLVAENLNSDSIRAADDSALSITGLVAMPGKLLAGTSGRGVFVIKEGAHAEHASAPRPIFVNSLARGKDGDLWFGADAAKGVSGIFLNEQGDRVQRIAAPTARVLALEENDGGLWVGTERYGLFHIADKKLKKSYTFENTSGGLRSDTIFTFFTDREGVLWIGTNRGVSRFDREGSFQQTVSDIPNSNFIRTLFRAAPRGGLYAGSNRGLFEYDGENWNRVPGFEEKTVYTLAANDNGILVGTSTGVFDGRARSIATGDTRSIARMEKTYAAILGRGVVDISGPRQDVIFSDETSCSLLFTGDRVWIGTMRGELFSFDGKTVKEEFKSESLLSGAIWKISQDKEDLWLAGEHGVFRIRDRQVESIIKVGDVRDVYVSGKDIWAATTTRGLVHARHDDRFGWLISTIGFEQGLPSDKTFAIDPIDGLLIATNRGVVTYRPATIPPKLIPVRVLSQRVHDLSELTSTIALNHPQNSLLIEVAGQSSRTFPEEFQYAFVLKNGKGDIVDQRLSNDAQYAPADLTPGNYTIESIAFNRDLLASDPLVITFSIGSAPFPWTATALGVLLLIALFGLVWAVIEHRRIVERNRELAAARLDLANEAERERRRIARDLHDQTLADLRNLMMTTDRSPTGGRELRDEIESISTDIRRICEDLSPSVLENVGVVAALDFLLSRMIENRRFTADETIEERTNLPLNVQLQVYRIAQEVLNNIVRHSTATEVEMRISASETGDFLLTIRDNGVVFQPDGTEQGRGISNIRSRANLINGTVAWKQSRRGGNVFALRVPPAESNV